MNRTGNSFMRSKTSILGILAHRALLVVLSAIGLGCRQIHEVAPGTASFVIMPDESVIRLHKANGLAFSRHLVCRARYDSNNEEWIAAVGEPGRDKKIDWRESPLPRPKGVRGLGASRPAVAIRGNNIYVLWEGTDHVYTSRLYLSKSSNRGRTWAEAGLVPIHRRKPERIILLYGDPGHDPQLGFRLADNRPKGEGSLVPIPHRARGKGAEPTYLSPTSICASERSIHILYDHNGWNSWPEGTVPSGKCLFYKRSDDGGETWTKEQLLNSSFGWKANIACDKNNVLVAWSWHWCKGNDIGYRHSRNNGRSWSWTRRTRIPCPNPVSSPSVAVKGGKGLFCWHQHWIVGEEVNRLPEDAWAGIAHSRYYACVVNFARSTDIIAKLYQRQVKYVHRGIHPLLPRPGAKAPQQGDPLLRGNPTMFVDNGRAYVLTPAAVWDTSLDQIRWQGPLALP